MSETEEPQVSWKVLAPGAVVVSADGNEAGKVNRVVGDAEADVFTGIAVKPGLLSAERLVPSERIHGIWTERVEVDLTKDEIESLPEYTDEPAMRIEPSLPGFFSRLFGRR
jgi:hypothetical protein